MMKQEYVENLIRQYRLASGLTQDELAQRVNVSRQSIISIEQGRYTPSLSLALKFARLFNTTVDTLFKLKDQING